MIRTLTLGRRLAAPIASISPAQPARAGRPAGKSTGGQASAAGQAAVSDALFAVAAADGGLTEVTVSELGVQKATDPELKRFSQHMVEEHTRMNAELAALATRKGVALPRALSPATSSAPRASRGSRARSSTAATPRPSW